MTVTHAKAIDYVVDENVPPFTDFIYQVLIVENSKWTLNFPINNLVSSAQVNHHVIKHTSDKEGKGGEKYLPQYMFTRSKVVPESTQIDKPTLITPSWKGSEKLEYKEYTAG
jgi:hypothetical protein